MVIDVAKGIEAQTLKLFEVCRLRDIPIITFANKVDREGKDPLDILDEIAEHAGARRHAGASGRSGRASISSGISTCSAKRVLIAAGQADLRRSTTIDDLLDNEALIDDPVIMTALENARTGAGRLPPFDLETYPRRPSDAR